MSGRPGVAQADIPARSAPDDLPRGSGDRLCVTHRPRSFASVPIPLGARARAHFARADIVVSGLEHGGPSYEVRIFLDNPNATAETRQSASDGYAGSINVYGYGQPPLPGPNDPAEVRVRPSRSIVATEAVREQASKGGEVTVTLVPIAGSQADVIDLDSEDVCVRIEEGPTPA